MTDPIRIPCVSCSDETGVRTHALITPDIARQIVALAGLVVGPEHRSLVPACISPAPVDAGPVDAGPACVCGDPSRKGVVHRKDGPCYHRWNGEDATPPPPADDAATQLAGIISTMPGMTAIHPQYFQPVAEWVIAAIRRGEVPGITTTDAHLEPWKQIAALRTQLDEANYWRHNYADAVKAVQTEMKAEVERLTQEREELSESSPCNDCTWGNAVKERDRLAAELAKERTERNADAETWQMTFKTLQDKLAALKARKVTLPKPFDVRARSGECMADGVVHHDAVVAAMRAAGVAVEGGA